MNNFDFDEEKENLMTNKGGSSYSPITKRNGRKKRRISRLFDDEDESDQNNSKVDDINNDSILNSKKSSTKEEEEEDVSDLDGQYHIFLAKLRNNNNHAFNDRSSARDNGKKVITQ
eukprot:Pgem_evm1s5116